MQNIEEKKERFKRLASQRTNAVLEKLKILGNCANRANYEYTDDEVNRIFAEIEHSVKETKEKFQLQRNRKFRL